MNEAADKFRSLVESASCILITAHISPDPDAVSSLLLLGNGLQAEYPTKKIIMILEEEPLNLQFIDGYSDLVIGNVFSQIQESRPDVIIIVDGNNYERISRFDGQKIRDFIRENDTKTVIVDHHEADGRDETDVFINNFDPAAAQTVYELLFRDMGIKKTAKAAQTAMLGFYADTGGFVYLKAGKQGRMFDFAEELVSSGANIESVRTSLSQYSIQDMTVLRELAQNIQAENDYTYSYLSDEFVDSWLKDKSQAQLQIGTGTFLDMFIRNIENRPWGFISYKNTLNGDNMYSVSLRAISGVKDVAKIANSLGGGGHKPAAGAKIQAATIQEALDKIKAAIT